MTRNDPDTAAVVFARSTMAHARLLAVDTTRARRAPGVLAVVLSDDLRLIDISVGDPLPRNLVRPLLARDWVRFAGEPIAAVVAHTVEEASEAAALLDVEYGLMPLVAPAERAALDDVLVHPTLDTNTVLSVVNEQAELEAHEAVRSTVAGGGADGSGEISVEVSVEVSVARSLPPPANRRARAAWRDDGGLHVTVVCDDEGFWRVRLSELYSLRPDQVHLTVPDGDPGRPAALGVEELLLPRIAQLARRPVAWTEAEADRIHAAHQRGGRAMTALTADASGHICRLATHTLFDIGAYPMAGAANPYHAALAFAGPYGFPEAAFGGVGVVTTLPPVDASLAGGALEVVVGLERAIDLLAPRLGEDPLTLRRRLLREAHGDDGSALLDALESHLDPSGATGLACPPDVESSLERRRIAPGAAVAATVGLDPRSARLVVRRVVVAVGPGGPTEEAARDGVALGIAAALSDEVRIDGFGRPARPQTAADQGLDHTGIEPIVAPVVPPAGARAVDPNAVRVAVLMGTAAAIVNAAAALMAPVEVTSVVLPLRLGPAPGPAEPSLST